jgi:hypothetical protein
MHESRNVMNHGMLPCSTFPVRARGVKEEWFLVVGEHRPKSQMRGGMSVKI